MKYTHDKGKRRRGGFLYFSVKKQDEEGMLSNAFFSFFFVLDDGALEARLRCLSLLLDDDLGDTGPRRLSRTFL